MENAGIQVYFKDEIQGTSAFNHFTPGVERVKSKISNEDYPNAKIVIDKYYQNVNKESR